MCYISLNITFIFNAKFAFLFLAKENLMAKKRKQRKKKNLTSIKKSISDQRIPKVAAVIITLMAIYLLLAFFSYLSTWKADQDQVFVFSWKLFVDETVTVENWLGRFGAIVSNRFFYWGIGLSSFISVFLLSKLAFILFTEKPLKNLIPPLQYTLTFILFFSPLLSFIFSSSSFPWGGAFGNYVSTWIINFVGTLGTALLFLFLGIAFLVWNFHHIINRTTFSFTFPKIPFSKLLRPGTASRNSSSEESPDDFESIVTFDKPAKVNGSSELEFDLPKKTPSKKTKKVGTVPAELEIVEQKQLAFDNPKEEVFVEPIDAPPLKEREKTELIVEEENKIHLEPYDPTGA